MEDRRFGEERDAELALDRLSILAACHCRRAHGSSSQSGACQSATGLTFQVVDAQQQDVDALMLVAVVCVLRPQPPQVDRDQRRQEADGVDPQSLLLSTVVAEQLVANQLQVLRGRT